MESTYQYLKEFAPELSERIIESFPPLHSPGDPVAPEISLLLRTPLPAQELAIMGQVKALREMDSVKTIFEMGCGKTFVSLATCFVHAKGRRHTAIVMSPPHIVLKWAREIKVTIPNARTFIIHDFRNGGDPTKPHGITEMVYRNGKMKRSGWSGSLADLRHMGRSGWKKLCPEPAYFIVSRESGKLSWFWKHAFNKPQSGKFKGLPVNPESGTRPISDEGEELFATDFDTCKVSTTIDRPKQGTTVYAPMWEADRSRIKRVAPLEYMGRYMKKWWDYAIADEIHELAGDTAQGNGLAVLQRCANKLQGLTGTLLGGYADDYYNLGYRMDPPQFVKHGYAWGSEGKRAFQDTYGTLERITKIKQEDNKCSDAGTKTTIMVKRRPGASPLLFGHFLLNSTSFLSLSDISDSLPEYKEEPVLIDLGDKLEQPYRMLEEQFKAAFREHPEARSSIVSLMLNTLLLFPDHPFGIEPIKARVLVDEYTYQKVPIAYPASLDGDFLYPKEVKLLETVRAELAQGRKCQVYVTYTGKTDVSLRVKHILTRAGFRVAVLKPTVATSKREEWYAARLAEGVDVVISHPKLVSTGLDLIAFPTLIYFETGYSLHTLRQASRRSWRLGQTKPVKVLFFVYKDTYQELCLRLMGKKMLVALAMEGKLADEGLQDLGEDDDSGDILTAVARELVTQRGVGESADAVWKSLNRERVVVMGDVPRRTDSPTPQPVAVEISQKIAPAGILLPFPGEPAERQPVTGRRKGTIANSFALQLSFFGSSPSEAHTPAQPPTTQPQTTAPAPTPISIPTEPVERSASGRRKSAVTGALAMQLSFFE